MHRIVIRSWSRNDLHSILMPHRRDVLVFEVSVDGQRRPEFTRPLLLPRWELRSALRLSRRSAGDLNDDSPCAEKNPNSDPISTL